MFASQSCESQKIRARNLLGGKAIAMHIHGGALFALILALLFPLSAVQSEPRGHPAEATFSPGETGKVAQVNDWTVGIAGGQLEGTFIRLAAELAKVLDDGDNLRVLPVVTYGAAENVTDLLYMHGVDVALTYSDDLEQFKRAGDVKNIDQRINYISELFVGEVHIYARPEISRLADLEGKKVGFDTKGAAPTVTAPLLFERLGIHVDAVFVNNAIGIEKMKSGEFAAIVHLVSKPNELFAKLNPIPGFHFLPVEFGDKFADYYVPATLTHADYPNLIQPDERIDTIAVPGVLAVYNWPKGTDRFRRVERFINYYFTQFDRLKEPSFHPRWKDVNLSARVPGWKRYWVADAKLSEIVDAPPGGAAEAMSRMPTALGRLDRAQVQDFLDQAERAIPLLPHGPRPELTRVLESIRSELRTDTFDEPKVRHLLLSVRAICERDSTNLVGQGILALLAKLIGA
jgi:TRAP-type uncharacterized transport system substrate-binding protein